MTSLEQCALELASYAGAIADIVKKHKYHGHPLEVDDLYATMSYVSGWLFRLQGALAKHPDVLARRDAELLADDQEVRR